MVTLTITFQDLFSLVTNKSVKKVDITDAVLPFVILPILILIASISRAVTITVMVAIAMGVLYVQSRPRAKNRSPFFFSWTLASCVTMFLVFEIGILQLLEITQLEHLIFLLLLACTCYFFYKMKAVADFELAIGSLKGKVYSPILTSDSHYCQVCQIEVNERFFHSIWWDCCIFRPNYKYFLCGQVFAFMTLLQGTLLGLTTVCQPYIFYGSILLPEDCDDVYFDYGLAISFVTCVYGLGYLLVIGLVIIHNLLVYIPKYSDPKCTARADVWTQLWLQINNELIPGEYILQQKRVLQHQLSDCKS